MRQAVRGPHGYGALPVRQLAAAIVRGAGTNRQAEVALIREWLQGFTQFVRDPIGLEWVMTPMAQLEALDQHGIIQGDCDDVAVLGAALGMAIGLRARFITIGNARQFVHVFAVLGDPSGRQWWELDITRPMQNIPTALTQQTLPIEV